MASADSDDDGFLDPSKIVMHAARADSDSDSDEGSVPATAPAPTARSVRIDDNNFIQKMLREKERRERNKAKLSQTCDSDSECEDLKANFVEFVQCAKQLKNESDLSDYDSDDESVGLFQPVPPFGPPDVPETVNHSLPWLSGVLGDPDGLKVWLENQQVESRLLGNSDLCQFVLHVALFHPNREVSKEAVEALELVLSCPENKWRPDQLDLLNALCDYGMDLASMPVHMGGKVKDSRKHLGIHARGSAVEVLYDRWCDAHIVRYDAVAGGYVVEADEDGDQQTFFGFPDPDLRFRPPEGGIEDDTFQGHGAINEHFVAFCWVLQICFEHRAFDLTLQDLEAWFVLLCRLRADPNISQAPLEASCYSTPWPRSGVSPAAALEGCVLELVEGCGAQMWAAGGREQLCRAFCSGAVAGGEGQRLSLGSAIPESPRGAELRAGVRACMLRRLTQEERGGGGGEEPLGTVGPAELVEMLEGVAVSGHTPPTVCVKGRNASVDELSWILVYVLEAMQDYRLESCSDAELASLAAVLERVQRWKRHLRGSSTSRASLSITDSLAVLECSITAMVSRQQRQRQPAKPEQNLRSFFAARPGEGKSCKRKHDFGGNEENVNPNTMKAPRVAGASPAKPRIAFRGA